MIDIREIELRVMVHRITDSAFLVSDKSELEAAVAGEWLAIQKGLV